MAYVNVLETLKKVAFNSIKDLHRVISDILPKSKYTFQFYKRSSQ